MAAITRRVEATDDCGRKRTKAKYAPKKATSVKKQKKPGGPRSLKAKTKRRVESSNEEDVDTREESGFIPFADEAVGASGGSGIDEGNSKSANDDGGPSKSI